LALFSWQGFTGKPWDAFRNLLRAADPKSGSVVPPYLFFRASNLPESGVHFSVRCAKQVFPKVAAGFGSKNLLDKGS
jgi:hypothetical protein